MIADKLYEIIREAEHKEKTIVVYVPCPWLVGVEGRPGGYIRAATNDAKVLLRYRGENLEVDVDESEYLLMVTISGVQQ